MEWIEADKELPSLNEGKVLIIYLEPSFGCFSTEVTFGYYDHPEHYEDENGKGWLLWMNDVPVKVTHWAKFNLPKVKLKESEQRELLSKYDFNLGTVPSELIQSIENG